MKPLIWPGWRKPTSLTGMACLQQVLKIADFLFQLHDISAGGDGEMSKIADAKRTRVSKARYEYSMMTCSWFLRRGSAAYAHFFPNRVHTLQGS